MLVGETGSGKSTLVDGMVNYVMGVSFDDPFRFTIVQLEEEENKIHAEVLVLTSTIENSDIFSKFHPIRLDKIYRVKQNFLFA